MVSVLAAQRVRAIKTEGGRKNLENQYAIEMLNITKKFPGIIANDNITLQLKKGEIHALLGENGAGKSTLMSVLFGLYQPEEGIIKKDGEVVAIKDPNDATALGIGMVHQHFKLVECFSVLDNIILGVEPNKMGFLQKAEHALKRHSSNQRFHRSFVAMCSAGSKKSTHLYLRRTRLAKTAAKGPLVPSRRSYTSDFATFLPACYSL